MWVDIQASILPQPATSYLFCRVSWNSPEGQKFGIRGFWVPRESVLGFMLGPSRSPKPLDLGLGDNEMH